ncbi:MAG: hypothetical protein A2X61_07850 [Ignavibacteria bacterium GWB2_35_12]|nr:MAG: hypothetical protein A2X63_13015 [Ignavibacteria bacterium GWA2_35_8]OGU39498.1 MAG: hypothetical protein A2X61_07850 [Ignavibacteria bacterium GWB2_35_12]OGU90156.1 MAG: hypothetical protein A2220_16205 [Ignavibacteria bacterium RIFOXYA2_FULL_35_10]OGV21890.1 MAG: hypothetical protein A2475_09710 [Ignavibacteria bacterium RIFOXYC2_FULL_35_21]
MNIAEEHFRKLYESESFRKAYIEESIKFDIEMKLNGLKEDIKNNKSSSTILKKVRSLENLVKQDFHLTYIQ